MSRTLAISICAISSLFIARSGRADGPAATQAICLSAREPEDHTYVAPLTIRELVRQAFLVAARDELGLSTRDVLLHEEFGKQTLNRQSVPFDLICRVLKATKDTDVEYVLTRAGAPDTVLWRDVCNLNLNEPASLVTLAEKAEAFSRGELKDVLKQAGWTRSVPARRPASDVRSAALDLLWSWNDISVMAGLRQVHAEIREQGESPELLGALAVGYANLGSLTEFYYGAGSKAHYARALLYAERLVRSTQESPWALWHRAYVRMQFGLHNLANEDIAAAKSKQAITPADKPLPFWTRVIDAFGQGHLSQMLTLATTKPQRRLARYLNVQAVIFGDLPELSVKAIKDLRKECPDCPRAYDWAAETRLLKPMREAVDSAFPVTAAFLRKRLLHVPGLPEPIRARMLSAQAADRTGNDPASEIEFHKGLAAELKQAGKPGLDGGEPSLSAIAHAIEEIDFAELVRRLEIEQERPRAPIANTIAAFGPLVAEHRYAAYVNTFPFQQPQLNSAGILKQQLQNTAAELEKNLEPYEITLTLRPMIHWIYLLKPSGRLHDWYQLPGEHSDNVFADEMLCVNLGLAGEPDAAQYNRPRMILSWNTSDKLPVAVAMRISRDWQDGAADAVRFERDYADDPLVMKSLADRYNQLKRYDDAERCRKRLARANRN